MWHPPATRAVYLAAGASFLLLLVVLLFAADPESGRVLLAVEHSGMVRGSKPRAIVGNGFLRRRAAAAAGTVARTVALPSRCPHRCQEWYGGAPI